MPAHDPAMLSILIVTYNGFAYLRNCLKALEWQTHPRSAFEVLVWDNASRDETRTQIPREFPWCRYFYSEENLGFAGGNNAIARHATGDTLILLNNDTLPDPHWLAELQRAMTKHPSCAIASKLVFLAEPRVMNSSGLFLLRDGRGTDRGFRMTDTGEYEAEEFVFGGCAAAIAIPRPPSGEPIFDTTYFMYCEDLDYAWRKLLSGQATVYAPRAVVRHAVGGSGGEVSASFWFYWERNRAITALKNADVFLAMVAGLGLFARTLRAILGAALRRPGAKYRPVVARALVWACLSYLFRIPRVLVERYDIRTARITRTDEPPAGAAI